jgi:PPOX class probable F420-dependent enzyme
VDERARRLLEGRNFATVSMARRDGSVFSVYVWIGVEGERITLNSSQGRVWPKILARDPRVTILVADRDDQYTYAQWRGQVVETVFEGAQEHIEELSRKYTGHEYTGGTPGEVRIKYSVEAELITYHTQG